MNRKLFAYILIFLASVIIQQRAFSVNRAFNTNTLDHDCIIEQVTIHTADPQILSIYVFEMSDDDVKLKNQEIKLNCIFQKIAINIWKTEVDLLDHRFDSSLSSKLSFKRSLHDRVSRI